MNIMDFLFSSKKKDKIIALFDIGSGSVGGAIVRIPIDGKGVPTILKSVTNEIKFHKRLKAKNFMKDMISALDLTVNALYNKKVGVPDQIVCVLASPWYLSETRVIKMKREKPFIFTK